MGLEGDSEDSDRNGQTDGHTGKRRSPRLSTDGEGGRPEDCIVLQEEWTDRQNDREVWVRSVRPARLKRLQQGQEPHLDEQPAATAPAGGDGGGGGGGNGQQGWCDCISSPTQAHSRLLLLLPAAAGAAVVVAAAEQRRLREGQEPRRGCCRRRRRLLAA